MKYRKGYKYQVADDDYIQTEIYPKHDIEIKFVSLSKKGLLRVKTGYASDGPSGPTIDRPRSHVIRGAVFHDALYQLMRMELLDSYWRPFADRLAYQTWLKDGMWKWRARQRYKAISKHASFAAEPKNKKKIYESPKEKP